MSRLTNKEWIALTEKTIEYYHTGHLRFGQSYMNALSEMNMYLYNEVTATEYDCFYSDDKIVKFIEFLNNPSIKPTKEV